MEIKNLKKAADRIEKAVKNKERIILYGDADLDGTTSVIVLAEAIGNLGGKISSVYFPDRENEGYGLNPSALSFLRKYSPALLITLDLGIGNVEEVKSAKKLGFKVIIVDHHEILDKIPKAEIVVDPKQKGDKSSKNLANVGITFKLAEFLLGNNMTDNLRKNFLELVALGTIADMMPKVDENEVFITEGLRNLEMTWRPGLRAFFEIPSIENIPAVGQKVARIISVLNVRDVQDRRPASFRLLTMRSVEDSKELIKKFLEKHNLRRESAERICSDIDKGISGKEKIIFEGDASWDYTVISTVASVLSQKYKRLTFIYKKLQSESQGTVRSVKGVDSVALMKSCRNLLISYGGHPMAAGFRVRNENLEKFKQCLIKNLKS